MKSPGYFFRRFRNDRIYSVISIVGLTIGMTTAFLISLYLINELSYDRQHKNVTKIGRVIHENTVHHFTEFNAPFLLGPAAKEEIPGVANYCRNFCMYGAQALKGTTWLQVEGLYSSDRQVFDMFTFQVKEGKIPIHFEPGDICVSESFAHKFLAEGESAGKSVKMNIKGENFAFTIKAVYADFQNNSTFKPEAIVPMEIGHKLITKYLSIIGDSSFLVNFSDTW